MNIRIIDSGKGRPASHMAKDKFLLDHLKEGEAILHLYEWDSKYPMTYGHFMKPEKFLVANRAMLGMDEAVRPTGGGFVFHQGDYAFSLLVSKTHPLYASTVLENYHRVNQFVLQILHKTFCMEGTLSFEEEGHRDQTANFCMARASKYDILFGNKKVGGAAQRTVKQGYLHQGSIFLVRNTPEFYQSFLLPEVMDTIVSAIEQCSFFPLGRSTSSFELQEARREIKEGLIQKFLHSFL